MALKLFKLNPEHWKEFRDIRLTALKTWPEQYGSSYEEEVNRTEETWVYKLSSSQAYVLMDGEDAIGMARAIGNSSRHVAHVVEIVSFFVGPAKTNTLRAAEKFFMQAMLDDLRKDPPVSKVKIRVNADQEDIIGLYHELGFADAGVEKREMKIGEHYIDQVSLEILFTDKF